MAKQEIAKYSIEKWHEGAVRESALQILEAIYKSPADGYFHNRAGICLGINAYEYQPKLRICRDKMENFFRCYELAKWLEEKGLVKVWVEGSHTFNITTTKPKNQLKKV